MKKSITQWILAAIVCITYSGMVNATTINFSGTVDVLGSNLYADGTAFSGSLTYDMSVADSNPNANLGTYFDAITAADLTIGTDIFSLNVLASEINITNDPVDIFSARVDALFGVLEFLDVIDFSGTAIDTDALPTQFSTWDLGSLTFLNGPGFTTGTLTSFSVPEPSTLALLGLGLVGISFLRRRHPAA